MAAGRPARPVAKLDAVERSGDHAGEDDETPTPVRRRRKGPRKLTVHRMTLALALVSTAPPLVMRYGLPGVLAAVAAVAYAVYLIAGKTWPGRRR